MDTELTDKLKNYHPSPEAIKLVHETQILLLVGPTGAGKDSLKQKLLETGNFHHIISHTTRLPRVNHGIIEQNGKDYHFIDKTTASKMLDENAFIEAKIYSGNLYGTSIAEIKKAHDDAKIAMTDIEVQGVTEYKNIDQGVIAIFLLPPDFSTWQKRLRNRYGDVVDAQDYRRRLQTAMQEIEELLNTNYYVAVINDDLEVVFKKIEAIVNSKDHTSPDDPAARKVAKKLSTDIKAYLVQNV